MPGRPAASKIIIKIKYADRKCNLFQYAIRNSKTEDGGEWECVLNAAGTRCDDAREMRKFQRQQPTANELMRMGLPRKVYFPTLSRINDLWTMNVSDVWIQYLSVFGILHGRWVWKMDKEWLLRPGDGRGISMAETMKSHRRPTMRVGVGDYCWLYSLKWICGAAQPPIACLQCILLLSHAHLPISTLQSQWLPAIQSNYSMECGGATFFGSSKWIRVANESVHVISICWESWG